MTKEELIINVISEAILQSDAPEEEKLRVKNHVRGSKIAKKMSSFIQSCTTLEQAQAYSDKLSRIEEILGM